MLSRTSLRFLALLLVLSIPFWILGAVFSAKLPGSIPLSALQFFAVATAAVLACGSLKEVRDTFKVPPLNRVIGVAILMPCVLLAAFVVFPSHATPSPISVVLLSIPVFFVAAASEEAGWSSVVTRDLLASHGPLVAGLIVGLIWAGWHLVGFIQTGRSWKWIALQSAFTVSFRVLLSVLFARSVNAMEPTIAHATYNIAFLSLPYFGSSYSGEVIALACAATTALAFVLARSVRASA